MGKSLIIVESPAKVKTIKKFLGPNYIIQASVGHIRDLPTKTLGVDEEHSFAPDYQVITGKEKVVQALREAAAKVDTVYLAPDPDREGEAIAWHIAELVKDKNTNIVRIQFNEITAKAVKEALTKPRPLNVNLFDAQQARRILDRLVGYKISPLLWKNVKRGISAGRVQSVALRLIVEREEERLAFVPEEYWLFKAMLEGDTPPPFKAELHKVRGKKPVIPNEATAMALRNDMEGKPFTIETIEEKERSRAPLPPFITSTLQQTASQRLGYGAKRTMGLAQRLYEGLDLGERGTTALITYMRTDSVRIAKEAQDAANEFIHTNYGKEYLAPGGKRDFKGKGKGNIQDAHEAIRPVDVSITPEETKAFLAPDQYQLYRLIWNRFMASQMAAAKFHDTTVSVTCGPSLWRAKGERILFPGFLRVMPAPADDNSELPALQQGQELKCVSLTSEQKFTQPKPRFSESSLVKELEEQGIGRPSTYATIITTLQDREYVSLIEKHFAPTDLGKIVCEQLRSHFTTLMDVGFTAHMEESLDKVAEGEQDWVKLLTEFSQDFNPTLALAAKSMQQLKTGVSTDIPCPQCNSPLQVKFGKSGEFLACTKYPECTFTTNYTRDEQGKIQMQERTKAVYEKVGTCPDCQGDLVIKLTKSGGKFIACSNYPKCTHAESISTGVNCPKPDCTGHLVEKTSKRGKLFYSCSTYPKCDYALWDKPVAQVCPQCNFPILVEKKTRTEGKVLACPEKSCNFKQSLDEEI